MRLLLVTVVWLSTLILLACQGEQPVLTGTPLLTSTPVRTATPAATPTATPVPTLTPAATPTATPVPTLTPAATPTDTPVPTLTPAATPTATPVPTPTPVATPTTTPVPTPTPVATPTTTPVPTPTPAATPTATPVPTLVSEERLLNTFGPSPRAMLYAFWSADKPASDLLEVTVTLQNDVEMKGSGRGLYLIACTPGRIAKTGFYFGLQTDVNDPVLGRRGKGAIFSRWYQRNEPAEVRLADTRTPLGGWTESGDYEGNFVSVRNTYNWSNGQYALQIRGAETEGTGRWFEYWVADEDGNNTWIGSLRFPLVDGVAQMANSCGITIEVYGRPSRPLDIPYWKVTVNRPTWDGASGMLTRTCYPVNVQNFRNTLVTQREDGSVELEVGLDRLAHNLEDPCPW